MKWSKVKNTHNGKMINANKQKVWLYYWMEMNDWVEGKWHCFCKLAFVPWIHLQRVFRVIIPSNYFNSSVRWAYRDKPLTEEKTETQRKRWAQRLNLSITLEWSPFLPYQPTLTCLVPRTLSSCKSVWKAGQSHVLLDLPLALESSAGLSLHSVLSTGRA